MWTLLSHVDRFVRAIAGPDLGPFRRATPADTTPPLARGTERALLVAYYVAVLVALALLYGLQPPTPPPFVYQGF